ncbi:hypothetical protein RB195_002357 [Necator americanus]|uniref:Calponin family repeat-containing domain protein n=1 Tax=Necator americanus TaxID=51031 RepID=A0ABR1DIN1_NECAM
MLLDYVQFLYVLTSVNAIWFVIFHIYCSSGRVSSGEEDIEPVRPPQASGRRKSAEKRVPQQGFDRRPTPKGGVQQSPAPLKIRAPEQNKMMGTYDPNYQTLAGLNNDDVFAKKDGGGARPLNIRAPAQNKMMGTYDPNYQTLAGLNNEDVFKKKEEAPAAGGNVQIRPPEQNKMVGTYDPNYQTLAGLNNEDMFKKKETGGGLAAGGPTGGGALKIKPPEQKKVMGTYDPNYQTLAGLNNEDIFKPKAENKKKEGKEDNENRWCTY